MPRTEGAARVIGVARRVARRVERALSRPSLILLYHRIGESATDPWGLAVNPANFAAHLDILRRRYRPVRLDELVRGEQRREPPPNAVSLTFDDGYADNLETAVPLLERLEVPATMFLTSGALGADRELWWDELDRLLLQEGELPPTLSLLVGARAFQWTLADDARRGEPSIRGRRWRAWEPAPGVRQQIYATLWDALLPLRTAERTRVLDALRAWSGANPEARPTHRALSLQQAASLARRELIEVGAHTASHPSLATLPRDEQGVEIAASKAALERVTERAVTSFAYPFGKARDYTADTIDLVRKSGFRRACVNISGLVRRSTDRYELPRMFVHDWSADEFSSRLSGWLAARG